MQSGRTCNSTNSGVEVDDRKKEAMKARGVRRGSAWWFFFFLTKLPLISLYFYAIDDRVHAATRVYVCGHG
jgi:hypothetical protein